LNLTRVTKKKETTPERHVLIPEGKNKKKHKKGEAQNSGTLFQHRTDR